MTETKTTYTAGKVTFVADQTPEEILAKYFTFTDTGLTIIGAPTQQHFDLCALQLATNLDKLRWQIGAWANEYRKRFGGNAYEKAVAVSGFSVKPETIEQWSYVERNVPSENRRSELSLWFHRIVAKLPPETQPEALGACFDGNMTYTTFNSYVAENYRELKTTPPPPPGNSSDRKYDLTKELYNLEIKHQERGVELKQMAVETSQLARQLSKAERGLWGVLKILATLQ